MPAIRRDTFGGKSRATKCPRKFATAFSAHVTFNKVFGVF